jgi:hypothetical protein
VIQRALPGQRREVGVPQLQLDGPGRLFLFSQPRADFFTLIEQALLDLLEISGVHIECVLAADRLRTHPKTILEVI